MRDRSSLPMQAGPHALVLCFRTEAQARALTGMAPVLIEQDGHCELLYCRPEGGEPADVLEPWLSAVVEALSETLEARVSLRVVDDGLDRLAADLRLGDAARAAVAEDPGDHDATRWARHLLMAAPIETIYLRGEWPVSLKKVVLGVESGTARTTAATVAAGCAAGAGAEVVAVATAGARDRWSFTSLLQLDRIQGFARSVFDIKTYQRVVSGRSREAATLTACRREKPDMVVWAVQRDGLWGGHGPARMPARLLRGCDAAIILVNAPERPAIERVTRAMSQVFRLLPTLTLAQRAQIYSRVRRSARGDTDFIFMIVAATAIAALGLYLDSAVVIIGAMLVAPLMSPILAAGLAVAQGDGRLLGLATRSAARGTGIAWCAACIIGAALPEANVTGEMLRRANPTLLDAAVACASGATGAYAVSRKGVSSSLPGAAIAVSLVPPLATSGMALSMGALHVAWESFLLFMVNMAAVAAAAGVVFVWMGFSPEIDQVGRHRTFGKGMAGLGAMFIAVTIPLAWAALQPHGEDLLGERVDFALAVSADATGVARVSKADYREQDGELVVSATLEVERPLEKQEIEAFHNRIETATGLPVQLKLKSTLVATVGGKPADD